MKGIFLNRDKVMTELKKSAEDIKSRFPSVKGIYLFGSLVRGDYHGLCDADIIVVFKGASDPDTQSEIRLILARNLSIGFDLILMSSKTFRDRAHLYEPIVSL